MKAKIAKQLMGKLGILASLAAVTLVIGHGCSEMASNVGSTAYSSNAPTGSASGGMDGSGGGFTPIPGASTVSLLYNKQLMDNMVTCVGIGSPSVATLNEYDARKASFAEYGYATDITAPMLMAVAAVSGEVCNDLINLESVLPAANRRIFNAFDFSRGPSSVDSAVVGDSVRRLARSCWARNEDTAELTIINEEVTAAKVGVDPASRQQTRNLALLICTSMLASLSGITF